MRVPRHITRLNHAVKMSGIPSDHDDDVPLVVRYVLEMRAWNRLYNLILASVEGVSTLLVKELHGMRVITGGGADGSSFDRPLAWRVVTALLRKAERT